MCSEGRCKEGGGAEGTFVEADRFQVMVKEIFGAKPCVVCVVILRFESP